MSAEPTDSETLIVVETALAAVLADLETAQAEQATITPRLAAAEGRVARLLLEEQKTPIGSGVMPTSSLGYLPFKDETHGAPVSGSPAGQLAAARAAHAEVAAEAQAAGAVVVRLQLRRDRLRKAQRTLHQRLGFDGVENSLRAEPRGQR